MRFLPGRTQCASAILSCRSCRGSRVAFPGFRASHYWSCAPEPLSFQRQKMEEDVSLPNIHLTEVEQTLQRLLLDVAKTCNPEKPSELRFTGGWVRDKLLGIDSHDIDVGIDDMTGFQFGLKMKSYLEEPGTAEKYGLEGVATTDDSAKSQKAVDKTKMIHGLHKIEANPEKSKHLETVTTKIFGLDIDLVNLRKETYTETSRNPQMEFGTPEEDALRRDATVNALFYNLQTGSVEDLTGWGLYDMSKKLIRTPLEPHQTFKDDPLRVLRLIRFATRLGYTILPEVEDAIKRDDIKEALQLKISRERVGVELEKMLRGPAPQQALTYIDYYGLYQTVFSDPTISYDFEPDATSLRKAYNHHGQLLRSDSIITRILWESSESEYISWLLTAFVPFADAPIGQAKKAGGKLPPPIATAVAREGIKAPSKICDIITWSCRNLEDIINTKDRFVKFEKMQKRLPEEHDPTARDTLGMAIRRWGPTWRSQLSFALMVEVTRYEETGHVIGGYEAFLSRLQHLDLLEAYDLKPIIDGTQLSKALETKPGPWMKDALDVVMAWQLRNPGTASVDEAIEEVKNKHGELTDGLIGNFLQLTIRPLFAKTQTQQSITAQGRRVNSTLQTRQRSSEQMDSSGANPLWKDESHKFVLDLLTWVVRTLDSKIAEKHWPSLIPPILALVDDVDTAFKSKGCYMLSSLLDATQPQLLARTGLGPVFEEAITPCLSYLPTLTPVDESIILLDAAYPTLLKLSAVYFPNQPTAGTGIPIGDSSNQVRAVPKERVQFISKHLHEHILPSISHVVDSHPPLIVCLVAHLSSFVNALAIDTVAHLIHLIPTLSSMLTSPFTVSAYPPLLSQAARTLQVVLSNAWPRAWYWRGEIARALCLCWVRISEEEDEDSGNLSGEASQKSRQLEEVKRELRTTVQMLRNAVEAVEDGGAWDEFVPEELRVKPGEVNWDMDVARLVEAEPKVAQLLER